MTASWSYPCRLITGADSAAQLPALAAEAGMKKPLIVTDPGVAGLPFMGKIVESFAAAGLPAAVFSDMKPNPTDHNVEAGVVAYRAGGHDGVVCVGGGSALDVGKTVAFMQGQTRPIWDFEDIGDWWTRADPAGIAPNICAPTTAGTGSEVGRASVVTNSETHVKKIIFHPRMMPFASVLDPVLGASLPAKLTAGAGMDALAHCFEAYCVDAFHPMADGIALEGMRICKDWLPRAVAEGADLEARQWMLAAASMGATAFQKGLGAIHSVSHPVGARYDTHHGLTNAVVFPYVMLRNRPAIEDKMDAVSRMLDLKGRGFTAVLDWVLELREALDIPKTLAELGVKEEDAAAIAADALNDPTAGANPIRFSAQEFEALTLAAIRGDLSPV